MPQTHLSAFALALAALLLASPLHAQDGRAVELTIGDVGVAIGDARRVIGLRVNFRDWQLEEVIGANLSVWTPHAYGGQVHGLTLGLPATGARRIDGVGAGIFGVAASETARGVMGGGLGVGAGGDLQGLMVAGIGIGAGGDVRGLQVAGVGVGAGGTLRWVSAAGVGIGARRIEGIAAAPVVGAHDVRGLLLAPAYFRIQEDVAMGGVSVSALHHIQGTQRGLAIGILNYARRLDGLQVGLLNYAGNRPAATRLLPFINFARDR